MKLKSHIIATITMSGIFYLVYRSFSLFIMSLMGGILIDIDHLLDYYLHRGIDLRVKNFFNWCYKNQWETLIIFLHSIELVFSIWLIVSIFKLGLFWIGLAIGISQHMILDIFGNRDIINTYSYFFIFRFLKGFRREYILRDGYGT